MSYLGGKWRLASWIVSHFPEHHVYVEPFGGGGSVLMRKPRAYIEVYNDLDSEVVNVFRVLRDPLKSARLHASLDLTPYAAAEVAGLYDPAADDVEAARRMIVRSFFLFAHDSVFVQCSTFKRAPQRAEAANWDRYLNAFRSYHERLRGVTIENLTAEHVIRFYDSPETLHYVDPPYVSATRSESVYRHEMSDDQHRRLAELLHGLKGQVILSGYNCPLYEDLYGDWLREAKPSRSFRCQPTEESIWIKPTR